MRPAGPLLSRCDRARGTPGRSHRRAPGRECSHPRRAEVIRAPCPGPASRRTTSAGQVTHRPSRVRNVWSRHSDVSGMRGPALGPTRAIFLGPGPGQSVGTPADGQAGRFVDQESPWMYLAAPATHPGCARSADRYVSCRRPASPMDELGRNTPCAGSDSTSVAARLRSPSSSVAAGRTRSGSISISPEVPDAFLMECHDRLRSAPFGAAPCRCTRQRQLNANGPSREPPLQPDGVNGHQVMAMGPG